MTHGAIAGLGPRTWGAVIDGWREEAAFRVACTERLAALPHQALAWECTPVSSATLESAFEDVAIDSPGLACVESEPQTFEAHFDVVRDGVATFANLGRDAVLVAPTPGPAGEHYPHLAAFVRRAPSDQADALWRAVAAALQQRLATRSDPVWVSTAGLGVYWLHVRLDDRPKYYRHTAFRAWPR